MSTAFYISFAALWILVIFQTLVLLGVTRSLNELRELPLAQAEEGTSPGLQGDQLPEFSESALSGETVDNGTLAGRLSALLFVSPDCSTCGVTLDELEALDVKTQGGVVVFCRSSAEKCRQLAETYRLTVPVIVDEDAQISRRFQVAGTPTAVLVSPDGVVLNYGQPMGADELEEHMLASAAKLSSENGQLEVVSVGSNRSADSRLDQASSSSLGDDRGSRV